jgi:hypothetical protein
MAKITFEDALYDRAKKLAAAAGYSSVDEFITHCVETEVKRLDVAAAEEQVSNQLRGLGYIE